MIFYSRSIRGPFNSPIPDSIFYSVLCLVIIALVVALTILIVSFVEKRSQKKKRQMQEFADRAEKAVFQLSRRYLAIETYNSNFKFEDIPESFILSKKRFNSKSSYDSFIRSPKKIDDCLVESVKEQKNELIRILLSAKHNRTCYSEYKHQTESLPCYLSRDQVEEHGLSYEHFHVYEKKITSEAILHPVLNPGFIITASYTTPEGRNHYQKNIRFSASDIDKTISKIDFLEQQQNQKDCFIKTERSKLSKSIRFDVLKRDNYTCQICGRNFKEDGVKLEIDHIIPVSKGGKTELSNLQTLCQDCNRGKSDKILENNPK